MAEGALDWRRFQDPDSREEGRFIWRAVMPDGYLVTVSEMSVGDWGWIVTSPGDGFPAELRYGFPDADAAKVSADLYVKENT